MQKLLHHARKVAAHPALKHSHHIAYVIYYAVAVIEEHGVHALIGSVILAFTCLTALASGE